MSSADLETTTISRLSANYYLPYASLPTTGVRTGELGYATDRLVLYRWSGTAWQSLTIYSSSGTLANRPNAATLPNGSIYYETDTATTDQVVAGAWIAINGSSGEGHITILPLNYDSIGQGTFIAVMSVSAVNQLDWWNSSRANLDNLSYKIALAQGTYTLRIIGLKGEANGILDVDIDAVEVASFDQYAATTTWNTVYTQTGIVIASAGLKTLKVRIDGKNAASINYDMDLAQIALWRTA